MLEVDLLLGCQPWPIFQYVGIGIALLVLALGMFALAATALRASEPTKSEAEQKSAAGPLYRQFSIMDLLILTSVLALQVAASAQNSIILFCLFITVAISVLALVWKRTLLRRLLLISMAIVFVGTLLFTNRTP